MNTKLEQEIVNLAKLPALCYSEHLSESGTVVMLKRGVIGYIPFDSQGYVVSLIDFYNARLGVTPAQRMAMECGSVMGFDIPGADPDTHDVRINPPLKQAAGEDRDAYLKRIGEEVAALFRKGVKQKS